MGKLAARVALIGAVMMLGACQARGGLQDSDRTPKSGESVSLTLLGYNYTDHYIDNYDVDGTRGGNVFLSNPTSGGSKSTCCVRWRIGRPLPVKVTVRWESAVCTYVKRVDDEDFTKTKARNTTQDVTLDGPVPARPRYFETHIYPDGHVEVAVTERRSPPRLKLPLVEHKRPWAKPWPACTPEQMREWSD